jgi:hypothetical protein
VTINRPQRINVESQEVLDLYGRATGASPLRAEACYRASRVCRLRSDYARGYEITKQAIGLTPPPGGLFVENWIYDYGVLDEYAVNACWATRYRDCLDAVLRALANGKVPPAEQQRFIANARFALEKMAPDR